MLVINQFLISAIALSASIWMPADKDCVSYSLLDCGNIGDILADDGVWDFSHLDKSGMCRAMYRCVEDSVVYEFFDDYRTDFVLRDSALMLSCRETADTRRVYSPEIPILPTGAEPQLTVEEIKSRWMSEYYISNSTATIKLPEAGKLIFEPGDTICPVIMIKQQIESSYLGANADGTVPDSAAEAGTECRRELRWYTFTNRYPVARMIQYTANGSTDTRLYVCPPDCQSEIDFKPTVQAMVLEDRIASLIENEPGDSMVNAGVLNAEINIGYSDSSIDITVKNVEETTISVLLTDVPGRVFGYRHDVPVASDGGCDISLNRIGLPPGQYLLYFSAGDKSRCEKIFLP